MGFDTIEINLVTDMNKDSNIGPWDDLQQATTVPLTLVQATFVLFLEQKFLVKKFDSSKDRKLKLISW